MPRNHCTSKVLINHFLLMNILLVLNFHSSIVLFKLLKWRSLLLFDIFEQLLFRIDLPLEILILCFEPGCLNLKFFMIHIQLPFWLYCRVQIDICVLKLHFFVLQITSDREQLRVSLNVLTFFRFKFLDPLLTSVLLSSNLLLKTSDFVVKLCSLNLILFFKRVFSQFYLIVSLLFIL